jgi:hypothetical protein
MNFIESQIKKEKKVIKRYSIHFPRIAGMFFSLRNYLEKLRLIVL